MTGDWPLETLVTMTFEEPDGKTSDVPHEGLPAGESREMAGYGWNESLDKLRPAWPDEDGVNAGGPAGRSRG